MCKRKISREILAPVGGEEQLDAALRCGADAVYFGAGDFNARRNAENFSPESFVQAVEKCHVRGVRAYITLNTLIKDTERESFLETLRLIAKSGADAVIVQDLSVAKAVREHCPGLSLHASTQMAVHNVSGAEILEEMGFSRIVLAREMSLAQIKAVCEKVNTEIEVFVHGAHCMSASGMCYMSSALGARSGNRGLCAQPCRLDFKYKNRSFALSLKDMSLINHLGELDRVGVSSFKIEGRMKRPEYVAAAVTAVKTALEGGTPDLAALKSVFSRSGFSDGYLMGKRTLDMFGSRTKEDVVSASSVLPSLAALYKDEAKRVGIEVSAKILAGEKSSLTLFDGENTVTVLGEVPQAALHLPLTEEMCGKSLLKLGGTPYYSTGFKCLLSEGIMLPASQLNALRREAIERLNALRGQGRKVDFIESLGAKAPVFTPHTAHSLRVRFEKASQIFEGIRCERLYLPLNEIKNNPVLIEKFGGRLVPEIPVLCYPERENSVVEALVSLKEKGIRFALCENIGAIGLCRRSGLIPLGGAMLNILNSHAAAEYLKLGVNDITLSTEMSFKLMEKIGFSGKFGYIAYGHMPLMRFRCCPMQSEKGCVGCSGDNELTDRRGGSFRVLCSQKEYSTLFNPIPLYAGGMKPPASDFATLYFTYETKDECRAVTQTFIEGKKAEFKRTAGLYDKELL